MIRYSLVCEKSHDFESWFPNSDSFDTQAKRGLVECPHCGSTQVSKALMAPRVSTSRAKEARAERVREAISQLPVAPVPAAPTPPAAAQLPAVPDSQPSVLLDETHAALRTAIRELHEKVVANTEDVGKAFPEQARKIHDGEAPARSIRGEATLEEAKALWEDGIPVLPIPGLPDDRN